MNLKLKMAPIGALITVIAFMLAATTNTAQQQSIQAAPSADPTRRVNIPHFDESQVVYSEKAALIWFGKVSNTSNYADARIGYNNEFLQISLHIIDRRLWYDVSPAPSRLTEWDAASLFLNLDGNIGSTPSAKSYRFVGQLVHYQQRTNYQAAYKWTGSKWSLSPVAFTSQSDWRGNYPNDTQEDRGWWVQFKIPFSSLGLSGPPADGSSWGLSMVIHDRDDANGTPIADQIWPETADSQRPSSWGDMVFGQPVFTPPSAVPGGTVTIRHKLNGAAVLDAHVGGHTECGSGLWPAIFTNFGQANYAGYPQINIQNQWDLADFACFSKYFVTFPLDNIPPGKVILSATLSMYQFGNADWGAAKPSLIQAFVVADDWNEATISWNNAPLTVENIAATWVNPLTSIPPWPGIESSWDVSRAVADAYAKGIPLRLALHSADGDYHSGKYFSSSDTGDWNAQGRPTLEVVWGDAAFELAVGPSLQQVSPGTSAAYQIQVKHGTGFTNNVTLEVGPAPAGLSLNLSAPTSFPAPGGQTTLTLTDQHNPSYSSGLWYTIPITATGGSFVKTASVNLLVNGSRLYLPQAASK